MPRARMFSLMVVLSVMSVAVDVRAIDITSNFIIAEGDSLVAVDVFDTPPDQTTLTMTGGEVTYFLNLHDNSHLAMSGGSLHILDMLDSSGSLIAGGEIYHLYAGTSSQVTVLGGQIDGLSGNAHSTVEIHGGTIADLDSSDYAAVKIYDGTIGGIVTSYGSSVLSIYGGNFQYGLEARGASTLNLHGSNLGTYLWAEDASTINIHGYNFFYNPTGGFDGTYIRPLLTGYWLDGTPFSTLLVDELTFDHINLVPEPATFILLITCAVPLLRRRFGNPPAFHRPSDQ